jgi:O-antigen ligase
VNLVNIKRMHTESRTPALTPLLLFFGLVLAGSAFLCIYQGEYYFAGIPFALLIGMIGLFNFRLLYYLLILCIPFSVPFQIGSFSIDLFSEPLMIVLLFISLIIFIKNRNFDLGFLKHPLSLLLLIHFLWMVFISFYSVNPQPSLKYLISKAWYIGALFFMTGIIIEKISDFKKIFWLYFSSLFLIVITTLIRHYFMGMGFETASYPMNPFFHNHVLYSSTLAIFLPFIWFARKYYSENILKFIILGSAFILFIVGIGFAYTRASWLAIPIALIMFFVIKKNMTKYLLILSGIVLVIVLCFFLQHNRYMHYASDYKKTIFHKGDIEGHLEATYKLEDASGMERVYRWIAASRMFIDKPLLGSGPSTFYPEYKKYTLNTFYTYVSGNPEQSSTHNYFLMTLCEQGIIGFILFFTLCISLILVGTRLYSSFKDPEYKNLAMACTISLVLLYFHLLLNDLIETDKIGALFFITLTLIIKMDIWAKKAQI